jgi:anhydro-N-acetylmuramic acid kinase
MKVIGLLSGTSIDGIDTALVEITGCGLETQVNLLCFETYPFPEGVKERILEISSPETGRVDQICHLNFYLGELFAQAALRIMERGGYRPEEIDLIGSHGQTIHHLPQPRYEPVLSPQTGSLAIKSTLQIGEPSIIVERTGCTVVADFRPRDIAAGGEGAPLAPYAHYLLFRDKAKARAVNNIGGISNVTFIPAHAEPDQLIAFDTGPGNLILDGLMSHLTQGKLPFDLDGKMAASGQVHPDLLQWLMAHPYLKKPPPKTTGREEFGREFLQRLLKKAKEEDISPEDLVATATAFTAESIADSYRRFLLNDRTLIGEGSLELILCGGGAKNKTLVVMLQKAFNSEAISVKTVEDYGYSTDALEAILFALLARATFLGVPSNIPSATGAKHPVILGKILPGRNWKSLTYGS